MDSVGWLCILYKIISYEVLHTTCIDWIHSLQKDTSHIFCLLYRIISYIWSTSHHLNDVKYFINSS